MPLFIFLLTVGSHCFYFVVGRYDPAAPIRCLDWPLLLVCTLDSSEPGWGTLAGSGCQSPRPCFSDAC